MCLYKCLFICYNISMNRYDVLNKHAKYLILKALETSESGHIGGSLSSLDILITLFEHRLLETSEPLFISNGHISPAVYSVLSLYNIASEEAFIKGFRQINSAYEGHISRHVEGVWYGTGPLGIGVSVAAGVALGLINENKHVFCVMGDGECNEGQVHEMAQFAHKYKLSNLTIFCDYNRVQLSGSTNSVMPLDIKELFKAYKWSVIEVDGHNTNALKTAIDTASDAPKMILCNTIMGYGIPYFETDGRAYKSTWHGKTPDKQTLNTLSKDYILEDNERIILNNYRNEIADKADKYSKTWDNIAI